MYLTKVSLQIASIGYIFITRKDGPFIRHLYPFTLMPVIITCGVVTLLLEHGIS
jgi:hypothetical protein